VSTLLRQDRLRGVRFSTPRFMGRDVALRPNNAPPTMIARKGDAGEEGDAARSISRPRNLDPQRDWKRDYLPMHYRSRPFSSFHGIDQRRIDRRTSRTRRCTLLPRETLPRSHRRSTLNAICSDIRCTHTHTHTHTHTYYILYNIQLLIIIIINLVSLREFLTKI